MISQLLIPMVIFVVSIGCQQDSKHPETDSGPAIVSEVKVSGKGNIYDFSVTLKSPDTGCDQYANWWEVISVDSKTLIYRRILAHSHVSEQPFTRSGGAIAISANQEVIVRAHMHPTGYGDGIIAMKGSVANGFSPFDIPAGFGGNLEKDDPQPRGCAF